MHIEKRLDMRKYRLFLTSNGLTKEMIKMFFELIQKKAEEIKVLYIPTAGIVSDEAREGFSICLYELEQMGIISENVTIYNLELLLSKGYKRTYSAFVMNPSLVSRIITIDELMEFDAVFVSGGDANNLCNEMVRTGFDEILIQGIERGIVYVGISAGSMFAAGNLKEGLHVIPEAINPHWEGTKIRKKDDQIYLPDGHVVYVNSDIVKLI